MTAHDEAVKIAREAWGRSLVLAMDAGVQPRASAIEIGIQAYLAAMLDRGWKMTRRDAEGDKFPIREHPMSQQRIGAAKMYDFHRANVIGLDQANEVWQAMWDAAPTSGTEG